MVRSRIVGTGSYAPQQVLTNQDLERMVDTSDEWIITRSGISQRHIAADGEATSDFACRAARAALEMAGLSVDAIDLIIVGTISPDMPMPSVACLVQHKLGARNVAAFDLSAGCTGFLYGLSMADNSIRVGACNTALIIGAETLSRVTDYEDRGTCVLFGDGAGAVVLQRHDGEQGVLATRLYADGEFAELLYIPGGGTAMPATHQTVDDRQHYIKMDGNRVFKIAVKSLEDAAVNVLREQGLTGEDVDLLVSHQANMRIIQAIAKRLRLPDDKVMANIARYGNTSAASIPIALDEANRQGRISPGHLLLFDAFGAGLTWGSALVRW